MTELGAVILDELCRIRRGYSIELELWREHERECAKTEESYHRECSERAQKGVRTRRAKKLRAAFKVV
jgi:hypothetical protein